MPPKRSGRFSSRIAPELSSLLAKAHQGTAKSQTVKVIVQYKQVPSQSHYATMQGRGGRLHARLHMIKAASFTIPVSALAALEADPEIASVTIDHPMNVMDDLTNDATGVDAAWNAGFTGTGIGVAVIDSGINDSHPDLWDATGASRVVYHQDFTGTATSNSSGAQVRPLRSRHARGWHHRRQRFIVRWRICRRGAGRNSDRSSGLGRERRGH